MNYAKKAIDNLKVGLSGKALKAFGMAAAGAITYVAVPTMIEAFSMKKTEEGGSVKRIDMTGWKGVLTGAGTAIAGGLMTGSIEFAVGAVGAMTAHVAYARLNDILFYPVFNTYLFRFDPKALSSMGDDMALPAGARQINVGGKDITILDRESVSATPVSGYGQGLLPEATPNDLSGYNEGLLPATPPTMNGYGQGLLPQAHPSNLSGYAVGLTPQSTLSDGQVARFMAGAN